MKKSLFRLTDMLELSVAYIFCFSLNLLLDYAKTLDMDAYILKAFLKNFIDYQPLIVSLFTFIVIVFHYQMLERKKAEIFCRILVGGTVFSITIRYVLDCLTVLIFAYLLSTLVNLHFGFNLADNFYLVLIFVTYILISARRVRKYENI
ncbi:hypothetical protein ADH66_03175 [Acutalibacter muris]|uniref:DUF5658 domain-containing protein n=1 Tax=Acutalibacter muris TaxID=1796620 RepID=A0ABN4ZZT7_9FIRM|nr:hypothetical protein A4V00_05800 [Hungateiclostridiaceae bacterium KB18]ASB39742.1 hypothetical protein ADH66_03175 [Acutalibacter muris]